MSWQVGAGGSDGATPSQYGLTKVISYKGPTAADTAASATLERVLHERNLYETEEEIACRQAAVATLIELVQSWMREEGLALGVLDPASDASWALQPGMVCMFGSFRLGVHGPGADMDTLVVGPHYITRQMFFEKFTKRLEERSDIVTDLSARTEAYVPLITMKLQGIEFDLLYAQMSATLGFGRADAGEKGALLFNIYDDMCLRGLDPKSVLSLNGARVTDMIRMLMPPESEDAFCTALIFIRLWAKKRGVYSNVHGYLGGISWALLVAQVCQLYPHAAPATLIEKFFALFQQWRWPYPIMLNEVKQVPELKLPVWDPKANFKDRQDLMPIITPAYPAICSTHNVHKATLKVLQSEFLRGHQLFEKFTAERKTNPSASSLWLWEELLQPVPFFLTFADYLDIKVSSRREEDQLVWLGYVESKVRQLALQLTNIPNLRVVPFPKPFTEKGATWTCTTTTTKEEEDGSTSTSTSVTQEPLWVDHFFIGLEFDLAKIKEAQAAATAVPFQSTTAGTTAAAASTAVAAPVQMNLSDPVNQFRQLVFSMFSVKDPERSNRGFNCDVAPIRARALPEWVFPDEKRPEGWGKKKGAGKKRKDAPTAGATTAAASAAAATELATMTAAAATPPVAASPVAPAAANEPAVAASASPAPVKGEGDVLQDQKRIKLENEPAAAAKHAPEMPGAGASADDALMSDMPKLESAAGTEIKAEAPAASTATAPSAAAAAAKSGGGEHAVHEMELALPEEPVIVARAEGTVDAAATTTAASDGTAADSVPPNTAVASEGDATAAPAVASAPSGPALVVAADNVAIITESSTSFEVKKRAPAAARGPMFKIVAAKPSPTPPPTTAAASATATPSPAPAAAGAAETAAHATVAAASSPAPSAATAAVAPAAAPAAVSSSTASPPLSARPSPPTGLPPSLVLSATAASAAAAVATPTKPTPSTVAAAPSSSSSIHAAPLAAPLSSLRPLQRSGSKPAPGARGRILTSDDLEDDASGSMQRGQHRPVQQQQQQQQPQRTVSSSSHSPPLLPMPAGMSPSDDARGGQQQQSQSQRETGRGHGRERGARSGGGGAAGGTANVGLLNAAQLQQQQLQQQQLMQQQQLYQQQLMMQQMMAAGGGVMNPLLMQQQQQQMMMMQQQQQQLYMMQQQQYQQQQHGRQGY